MDMPLDKAEKLSRLEQRSVAPGRAPIESLSLEPLPAEIIRAFPAMRDWEKRCNARLSDFVTKMNTVVPT